MNPAIFRQMRLILGLDTTALGARFGYSGRAVRYWEAGTRGVPALVARELVRMVKSRQRGRKAAGRRPA